MSQCACCSVLSPHTLQSRASLPYFFHHPHPPPNPSLLILHSLPPSLPTLHTLTPNPHSQPFTPNPSLPHSQPFTPSLTPSLPTLHSLPPNPSHPPSQPFTPSLPTPHTLTPNPSLPHSSLLILHSLPAELCCAREPDSLDGGAVSGEGRFVMCWAGEEGESIKATFFLYQIVAHIFKKEMFGISWQLHSVSGDLSVCL